MNATSIDKSQGIFFSEVASPTFPIGNDFFMIARILGAPNSIAF